MNYHISKGGTHLVIRQPKGRSFQIVLTDIDGNADTQEEFDFHMLQKQLGAKFNLLVSELCKRARQYKVRRFIVVPFLFDGDVFEGSWTTRDYREIPASLFRVQFNDTPAYKAAAKFIEHIGSSKVNLDNIW